jgi:copper transport outer membrane protein MctB
MINLRYHIVSLTAVFLALGLGILAGTTVIDQGVVSVLDRQTNQLRKDLNAARGDADGLRRQIDLWEKFGTTIAPPLLRGRLAGRAVVVLAARDAPGDELNALTEALTLAGARQPTRLTLTDRWALEGEAQVEQLAQAIGVQATNAGAVTTEAATRLAGRIAGSSDPRRDGDTLKELQDAGFIAVADLPGTGPFPAANAVVIVMPSPARATAPSADAFWIPLLRELSGARIAAVAESSAAEESVAEKVRGDRALGRSVCTVDHADTVAGSISLVYALRDLGAGRTASHYGVRGGAEAVAPDVGAA